MIETLRFERLGRWRPVLAGMLSWCAFAASTPLSAGTCGEGFVQAPTFPTQPGLVATAFGDLDGDGLTDLVTGSQDSIISVQLAGGAGGFGAPISTAPVPGFPTAIVTGPFNAGAATDVVVATQEGVAFVFTGNGDGTLDPPSSFAIREGTTSLAAADLSGDGVLDLIGGSSYGIGLQVFLGAGDGTFGPAATYSAPDFVTDLATADFDDDGNRDVIAATFSSAIAYYAGLGGGSLDAPLSLKIGSSLGIAAADFDGDGFPDIAVGTGTYAAVMHGNGDGTFLAAVTYPLASTPVRLLGADLDGDGRTDLAALTATWPPNGFADFVAILLQQPDGTLRLHEIYHAAQGGLGFGIGLFDGDGILDVAAVSRDVVSVALLAGIGDGSLVAPIALPLGAPPGRLIQGAFVEGQGNQLAVLASQMSGQVSLFRSANGRSSLVATLDLAAFGFDLAAADFDGDGHLDIAASDNQPALEVFFGHGNGTFEAASVQPLSLAATRIVPGDFNGDGLADLATIDFLGDLSVLINEGGAQFSGGQVIAAGVGSGLVAARLDVGATLDLAATSQNAGPLLVLLGTGDGTFAPALELAAGSNPSDLAAGDFNQDESTDLVVADAGGTSVAVLLNQGGGAFSEPIFTEIGTAPQGIAVGDFDFDGFLDAATSDTFIGKVSILMGTGDGLFDPPSVLDSGLSPFSILALASGGLVPDLAVANMGSNEVDIFVNRLLTVSPVYAISAVVGSPVRMASTASGLGPLAYQWRKDGVPLSDGGAITGSQTPVLTIDPVSFDDAGSYGVVVTNSCSEVTSNAASLSVEFADVPVSSPFHDDILTIATDGIAAGCGGGNYCPTSPVRRDQMAVFLLKSEHGSNYTPPGCAGVFDDVPCPSPFADWIEQLAAESITGGCGGDNYCPANSVTRAQMAIFLLKTSEGSGYTPPPATGIFGDVPVGSFGADFIEELYDRGITGGCSVSPLLYCPDGAVLRQQMATFLVRTFFP